MIVSFGTETTLDDIYQVDVIVIGSSSISSISSSSSANSAMPLLSHEICHWVVADKCGMGYRALYRLRRQQVSRRGIQVMDGSVIATESSRV